MPSKSFDDTISVESPEQKELRGEGDWIVKVHEESGSLFYTNSLSGKQQWQNPFDQDAQDFLFRSQEVYLENEVNEICWRGNASLDKRIVGDARQDSLVKDANRNISSWVRRHDLSFEGSVANARLQYPEYVDPCFGGGKPPRAGCRLLKFPIPASTACSN